MDRQQFFRELCTVLGREGFTTQPEQDDLLPVEWDGRPLCRITEGGGVRYWQEDVATPERDQACERATNLACMVQEYMTLMEQAPPLKAQGLSGDFRVLADFNGTVLAGHPTQYGVHFVTWDWNFDRTGLNYGRYFQENYSGAKQDFATRSGLISKQQVFNEAQLTEIYRCCADTLDAGFDLTYDQEQCIKGVQEQILSGMPNTLINPFLDGDPTLNPDKGDFAIRVKLASRSHMDGVWVGFPDTGEYMDAAHPDELLLALDALEVESLTECIAVDVDCCLPQLEDILSQYSSAAELVRHAIDFGYAWGEQGQGEPRWLDKWQAVMELEDCHRLDYALDLAQNLHCYHFMPRDMELTDFGKTLAKQDGVYPKDELLASCFDAESYANQRMKNMGLSAAEHGFVSWNGTELVYEYSQPDVEPTMSM